MIRINLLAVERRVTKSAAPAFALEQHAALIGVAVLLVTAAAIGWRYMAVTQHEGRVAEEMVAAQREEQRLGALLTQVTEFEAQRAQLQQRVALIDELRNGQTAPVHMVDQISRSLPELSWLTGVKQEGYDVTITGRSTSLAALSDFASNLELTRYFARPIEIVDSEVVSGKEEDPDLIDFTIKGTFQMAGLQPAPEKTGKRPAAKGKRG